MHAEGAELTKALPVILYRCPVLAVFGCVTVYFMHQLKVLTTWPTGNSIFTLSMSFRVKYAIITNH